MTKKLSVLLLLFAASLWAAEFWASKPYTAWSEKEISKLLTDSPWARNIDAVNPAGPAQPGPGVPKTMQMSSASDVGGAMWGGRDLNVVVLWQSAMPVKQALMKAKYGPAVATSAEAQTILQRPDPFYVIRLVAFPLAQVPTAGDAKQALLGMTTLSSSGRMPLVAEDVQVVVQPPQAGSGKPGGTQDVFFFFSRTAPFTDDKHVEFATKVGPFAIKRKFSLKDMVVNGKLEI